MEIIANYIKESSPNKYEPLYDIKDIPKNIVHYTKKLEYTIKSLQKPKPNDKKNLLELMDEVAVMYNQYSKMITRVMKELKKNS